MAAVSSFSDVVHLSDFQIKDLLGQVDQKDIIRAVKGEGTTAVKGKLFANMSSRIQTFMQEELEFTSGVPVPQEEVKAAQDRIVNIAKKLG